MTTRYRRRGRDADEDEALDENGILRDGYSLLVPMTMHDSVQRAVAQSLHDGHGNRDVVGHRPGFIMDANDARAAVEEAYRLRDEADANAWRAGGRKPDELIDEGELRDMQPLRVRDGMTLDQLEHEHQRRMSREYQAYDNWVVQQWRSP
jgi:hypothetical protein